MNISIAATASRRKKLNLGLAASPVDHVVVPPIDGFHADAVLAQRDDHHSLGEIPSGPRAIVPEPHTNILRPRLALLERASHGEERRGTVSRRIEASKMRHTRAWPIIMLKSWQSLMECSLPAVIENLYYATTSSCSALGLCWLAAVRPSNPNTTR